MPKNVDGIAGIMSGMHDMDIQYLNTARRVLLSSMAHLPDATYYSLVDVPPIMKTSVQLLVAECAQQSIQSIRNMFYIHPGQSNVWEDIGLEILPPELQKFFGADSIVKSDEPDKEDTHLLQNLKLAAFDNSLQYNITGEFETGHSKITRFVSFQFSRSRSEPTLDHILVTEHDAVQHGNLSGKARRNVWVSFCDNRGKSTPVTATDKRVLERVAGTSRDGKFVVQSANVNYSYMIGSTILTEAAGFTIDSLVSNQAAFRNVLPVTDPALMMFFPPDKDLAQMTSR